MSELRRHRRSGLVYRPGTSDELVIKEMWEENVYRIPPSLGHDVFVVDCGANIGAFTAYVCEHADNVRAVCVEPDPWNRDILVKNLEALKQGTGALQHYDVVPAALWWESGEGHMFIGSDKGEPGGAHLIRGGERLADSISVDTITLHDLLSPHAKIDVLKMDIEGGEYAAFHQYRGSRILSAVDYFCMEYHSADFSDYGRMIECLLETHEIAAAFGPISSGGQLYARRYR